MKGQGLPITTIVLITIAIAIAALFIIYILTSGGKGVKITDIFWTSGKNLSENASAQAGQQAPPLEKKSMTGERCFVDTDCYYYPKERCYSKSWEDYQKGIKTCNGPAGVNQFCTSTNDCAQGLVCCDENSVSVEKSGLITEGTHCGHCSS